MVTDAQKMSPALLGNAALMTQAFNHVDMQPIGAALLARAEHNPYDGNALMDLSAVLQILGKREEALAVQAQALTVQRLFHLPVLENNSAPIRLLALCASGDLMANTPLDFLIDRGKVSLNLLYLSEQENSAPVIIPEHDILFVAVGESTKNKPLLAALEIELKTWPRPVINSPELIISLARHTIVEKLRNHPDLLMPETIKVSRAVLTNSVIEGGVSVVAGLDFPVLIRPVDSHGGQQLEKITNNSELEQYIQSVQVDQFYISRFVDYMSSDGWYKKYRIVLIEGRPFAVHLAISKHWMVHYLNADMLGNAENRAEEALFMRQFDEKFAHQHAAALQFIFEQTCLEYLILDCAESKDGKLLIFEVDTSAVVHNMDDENLFPYKKYQMEKVFIAFHQLLQHKIKVVE
jgi:glutathione synthase/RimK-type ligase-like ATP-grasp enzyme